MHEKLKILEILYLINSAKLNSLTNYFLKVTYKVLIHILFTSGKNTYPVSKFNIVICNFQLSYKSRTKNVFQICLNEEFELRVVLVIRNLILSGFNQVSELQLLWEAAMCVFNNSKTYLFKIPIRSNRVTQIGQGNTFGGLTSADETWDPGWVRIG